MAPDERTLKRLRALSAGFAAAAFGAVTLASQTLVLRRFLWRFESTETGVALFLSCWLFWSGAGAAAAATPPGRRLTARLARCAWLPAAVCAALYFAHYALIGDLRGWMGLPGYQTFPLLHLALGCFLANAPFCFVVGWGIPALSRAFARLDLPVSRAFACEALGSAACGAVLTALLASGVSPDPRDAAEWFRFFPQAAEAPGRFETGGGTTLYGTHGGTFYALTSGGVSEVIPEGDRAMEQAVLALSQRPYAASALLLGQVPLATALALESLRPDLAVTWCPSDARYGERLLSAVAATGLRTQVRAAGETPRRFLENQPEPAFDLVLALPPSATSLGGAAWSDEAFIRSVRRATRRTGAALFGLSLGGAHMTPEKAALVDAAVRPVRRVWPEGGCLAAGAGGWWIAAQVGSLAYGADAAPARFALLKRNDRFPAEAVALLYDAPRAHALAGQWPILDPSRAVLLPEETRTEEALAIGLADALKTEYPETTPGAWLAWLKDIQIPRLLGLLLVVLWMAPVAFGRPATAPRRLWAAWLAACGALGLVVSLAVLYRLQIRFGALYLLAGAGSSLYLGGLFLGNVLGERLAGAMRDAPAARRTAALGLPACQAGIAYSVLLGAERLPSALGVVVLCLAAGCAAGAAVPLALSAGGGSQADDAAGYVLADELGAALAGLAFVLLVPLAGLWGTVLCFAALAVGLGICAALCGGSPRLGAGLAIVAALALSGGHLRDHWPVREDNAAPVTRTRPAPPHPASAASRGIPRRFDERRVRDQMRDGKLATNEAAFWE
jgi:hypothetical protein